MGSNAQYKMNIVAVVKERSCTVYLHLTCVFNSSMARPLLAYTFVLLDLDSVSPSVFRCTSEMKGSVPFFGSLAKLC